MNRGLECWMSGALVLDELRTELLNEWKTGVV